MHARILKTVSFCSLLSFCFCTFTTVSTAQSTTQNVTLYSPYTKIAVPPGQLITYSIDVINNSNTTKNIDLGLSGLPRGWTYTLKSGGWNISRISVLPKKQNNLSLQVQVPLKVNKGAYQFQVSAKGVAVLPLTVVISKKGTYKTTFSTEQPNLEGAANSTFTFNASLANQTIDTQLYALNAQAPPGWNIDFKANYKQVSSVNVDANHTQNITIDIHPPDQTPAGTYKIPVFASTNNTSAGLELEVAVTGSYAMELSTPSGLLSTNITAGNERQLELSVKNNGSAPLKKITLSSAAPVNWTVDFDPKQIDLLPAGGTAQVSATIKADKNAIAGDYVTSITAQTPATSSKADIRVSVNTPVLWGWMGIIIILIALGSVFYLFRKFGRR